MQKNQPRKQEHNVVSAYLYKGLVEKVLGIIFVKYDDYQVIGLGGMLHLYTSHYLNTSQAN